MLSDPNVSRFYPPSYGRAIWEAVLARRPQVMIEFGVHRGYTAIVAALAMEEAGHGHLRAYDWWEDGHRDGFDEARIALEHFERYGVGNRINLQELDFFEWLKRPEPCELLYFDIDNDGAKVRAMFEGLRPQIEGGLTILFEGGSDERDRVPTAQVPPIAGTRSLTGYRVVVEEFPSLSMIAGGRRESV